MSALMNPQTPEEIAEWKSGVAYFWREKSVENYCWWRPEVCARVWPAFFALWTQYNALGSALDALARDAS